MTKRIYPSEKGAEYGTDGTHLRVYLNEQGRGTEKDMHAAVEFIYPSYFPQRHTLRVGLESCRAVDGFRVWFSFPRNCWVVEMHKDQTGDEWMEKEPDDTWYEVTTIPAWFTQEENHEQGKQSEADVGEPRRVPSEV